MFSSPRCSLIVPPNLAVLQQDLHDSGVLMKVAIYARVSTNDQNCELQPAELREYIIRRGWENAGEYADKGWSGAKAHRPEFDRLMRDAGQRRFDVVLCCKLDRFGRSLLNCKGAR